MRPLPDAELLAAAMVRAHAITANVPVLEETETAMRAAMAERGVQGQFGRRLDTEGSPAMRWYLEITTDRGAILLDLIDPEDWARALEDAGL